MVETMAKYKVFETVQYSYEYEADSEEEAVEMNENDEDRLSQQVVGVTELYAELLTASGQETMPYHEIRNGP